MKQVLTLPNVLTLVRLIASPIILPGLFVFFLPYNSLILNCIIGSIFLLVASTDFFDGYYARQLNQVTIFGSFLDPIADKFLFLSALIGLLGAQKIFFYWVIILIGREFFVMALRMMALEKGKNIPVLFAAKVKTAVEICYLAVVICNANNHRYWIWGWCWLDILEWLLLSATLTLSLLTAYWYYGQWSRLVEEARDV